MKKEYLKDMETEKRNYIIKLNRKLMEQLQADLYEYEMNTQQEEGELMFGKDSYKYIEIKDHYSSFYLVLKNWRQFIDNLDTDYFSPNGQDELYKKIIEKREKLDNMDDPYSDDFYNLEDEIEKDCKELLKLCENQLHEYEQTPNEDDAIQYADEMERLEDYYIEIREDGTSDNVIRLDVSYTETFI